MLDLANLTDAVVDAPLPNPQRLADNLILFIGENQSNLFAWVILSREALPSILGFPIEHQPGEGIEWLMGQIPGNLFEVTALPHNEIRFRLTGEGWRRREDILHLAPTTRRAFMAMQFNDPELNRVVEDCFKPAAARAGFELRLLTDGQGAGLIDDQMRVALRTSRFVVADLSHGNKGAYWESGFAEGLGRPVFYTCREDVWHDSDKRPHFDTRHLATVIWNPSNLKQAEDRLASMIRATLPTEAKLLDE